MNHTDKKTDRPPIVVVMGHVDHGKSTLLDFIRKSNTVAKEAGGITQHVAAYEVSHKDKRITFIDTPGHAAFAAMRVRGANVADMAILVVAADDGVKAQTIEALESIRESKIPFVVAINKTDKPNANIERTQSSLSEHGVYLDKLGGDVSWTAISAKTGTGIEELLDLILIVAEMHELSADSAGPAEGYCVEAHRDTKRGLAATLIITNGTLKNGMAVLAGRAVSPVRIMEDYAGKRINSATFSMPISLTGFDDLPNVGVSFSSFRNKKEADDARNAIAVQVKAIPAVEIQESEHFALPIIVRADTSGSLEAVLHEAAKLNDGRSSVRVTLSGIGNITENDVKTALAGSIPAIILGFSVMCDRIAEEKARQSGIRIETFDIIYKLAERLEYLLQNTRPKISIEEVLGKAKILKQFSSRKETHVVGGSVLEGYLAKGASVRTLRRGTVVGIGKIKNMQSHKRNMDRVEAVSEFGAQIESPFEIVQGDVLECFITSFK